MARPRSVPQARCREHPDAHVVAAGRFTAVGADKQRYQCQPEVGPRHHFSVPLAPAGEALLDRSAAPACPEHPGSHVVRNGVYGKTTERPRQIYRCTPSDGGRAHQFTPLLARDHVHQGTDQCDTCDELRGVHHGDRTAAHGHSWNARLVARGLERLSLGESYAAVGRWAREVTGTDARRRRSSEPAADNGSEEDDATAAVVAARHRADPSRLRRNAWQTAADWTEVFAPVVCEPVLDRLQLRAQTTAEANERARAAGQPYQPQVLLLDDVPVYGQTLDGAARRDGGFYLLVVAEQYLSAHGVRRTELRLVRAMAKSNTAAWRLVFDELGYEPEVVVSDAGTGIVAGVQAHFDPAHTAWIPSLWHVADAIEEALSKSKAAKTTGPSGERLIAPLGDHLRLLSRSSGVLSSQSAWSAWWDDLEQVVVAAGLPLDGIRVRRRGYEEPVAAALELLAAHPQVPVGSGALEKLIQRRVEPLLAGRRHAFGNIERTNNLFDLVVARHHGAFDNLAEVARLIEADMRAHHGHAPPLRAVADPKRGDQYYSSLRDEHRLHRLAASRKLL